MVGRDAPPSSAESRVACVVADGGHIGEAFTSSSRRSRSKAFYLTKPNVFLEEWSRYENIRTSNLRYCRQRLPAAFRYVGSALSSPSSDCWFRALSPSTRQQEQLAVVGAYGAGGSACRAGYVAVPLIAKLGPAAAASSGCMRRRS